MTDVRRKGSRARTNAGARTAEIVKTVTVKYTSVNVTESVKTIRD
jgi:hypothetical protein